MTNLKTRLIIAEKPDMGRKIASALAKPHKNGQGFIETQEGTVTWCIGHIMKSFEPEDYDEKLKVWSFATLPIIPDPWKIKIDGLKSSQFKVIKSLLANASEVINAGDPGREGQLIVDEVLDYLKNKKPVKRILLYSLDMASVKQAFNQLQDNSVFKNLFESGVCRGFADWTMGMNATRAYTLMAQKSGYKGVLSVGRVQTPTLAIVVKRDLEIENFVSHEYFNIIGNFSYGGKNFNAYWKAQDTTNPQFLDSEKRLINAQEALRISNIIIGKKAKVSDYEEKEGKENAPLPFNLSKLQIYANSKWGMSAKDVLDTCQSLYETHELQTYPRTDCQYLPENLIGQAPSILNHIGQSQPNLLKATQGANTSLKSPAWNDSKLGEHFGLIPTQKQADMNALNDKEKKIYQAVCERYIAQFYPACEFTTAHLSLICENELFKANGKVISSLGWKAIFANQSEDEEKNVDEDEQIFPALQKDILVDCVDSKKQDKKTTPPPRYTEGTLIAAMTNVHTLVSDPEQKKKLKEKKGIGQEATRTQIIETLFKRQFLLKQGKTIISSDPARTLISILPKKVIDPALTAVWEDALDKIASGQLSSSMFKEKQKQWIAQLIQEAQNADLSTIKNVTAPTKATSSKASVGKSTNKTYSKSPTAKNTASSTNKTMAKPSSNKKCPKCDVGYLVERTAKASGNKFLGCNNYPKCNHAEFPKK